MTHKTLDLESLKVLVSFVLPAGCTITFVPDATYRVLCPNYKTAHQVWKNHQQCISPLLSPGAVVEVIASDFYARSHPKL
ncbi:hypothetical protein PCC7424_2043 [Gloeothece citriformis PCC 7424]|uniref:Uncharacterized protein n=1 Tax=Gloeothece citriformis (strain PCC 7424) TaxID=65393 RepID=B7KF15_GLOC7|nr:hypothetical protein [Gloeothece citriformis]ACK70471.1 hypothetical protein PCC7424_2043 [Gloeothece citriformis PCC 7424]